MKIDAPNEAVRRYWEQEPCGTGASVVGELERESRAWFMRVEENRYLLEPFIHGVAQFTRHAGKRVLEIGVGAGTDHLQWARAGADCYGVDLTDAAIQVTRHHLASYGHTSRLQRADAESLPFDEDFFDVVYSWGVIHHSREPERIVREIHRVLAPGGVFIGMFYRRYSVEALKVWIRHGMLAGRPWRTLSDVIAHHMESPGTKAYTKGELQALFSGFQDFSAQPLLTPYDKARFPRVVAAAFPDSVGWFFAVKATKPPEAGSLLRPDTSAGRPDQRSIGSTR